MQYTHTQIQAGEKILFRHSGIAMSSPWYSVLLFCTNKCTGMHRMWTTCSANRSKMYNFWHLGLMMHRNVSSAGFYLPHVLPESTQNCPHPSALTQSPHECTFCWLSHDDWQFATTWRGILTPRRGKRGIERGRAGTTDWQASRGRLEGRERCCRRRSERTSKRLNLKWKIERETDGRTVIRMERQRRREGLSEW